MNCKCGERLIVDKAWLPPRGIDPQMQRLFCPRHLGIFYFKVQKPPESVAIEAQLIEC